MSMKLVTFVLTFLGPGGGHVLARRTWRGLAFLAAAYVAGAAAVFVSPLVVLAMLAIVVGAAIDAARVTPSDLKPAWTAWLIYVPALWALQIGLRLFVIEAFSIPASSMSPTLLVGDHIFITKLDREVRRGDVIVFVYPVDPRKDFVKRAVAIAGDRVKVRDGVLYVNGVAAAGRDGRPCEYPDRDEYSGTWTPRAGECVTETLDGRGHTILLEHSPRVARGDFPADAEEYVVPPDSVFTLGDNRSNSHDSRYWGPVPLANLRGKVWKIWWSSGGPDGIRWARVGQPVQ